MQTAFDSLEVKKKTSPKTILIELVDQRDSGWVLDGTERTNNPIRITSPSAEFIPNRGFRLVKFKNEKGEEEWINEPIRFIKNCPYLSIEEQNKRGYKPSKNRQEDLIILKKGHLSVTREGSYIPLYDYIEQVFYNTSNPNRPSSAKGIFRVVELGKKEELINEKEMAAADAVQFISTLFTKQGKEYRYNEDKINALCQLFVVFAETPAGKVNGLIAHAKKDPQGFLDKALRLEQSVEMEITDAIELNVIRFDGNSAVYCNKDKVIAMLGQGMMKKEKKIEKLANLFVSEEYKQAYEEFLIELDIAKTKTKNNK